MGSWQRCVILVCVSAVCEGCVPLSVSICCSLSPENHTAKQSKNQNATLSQSSPLGQHCAKNRKPYQKTKQAKHKQSFAKTLSRSSHLLCQQLWENVVLGCVFFILVLLILVFSRWFFGVDFGKARSMERLLEIVSFCCFIAPSRGF